ncbi:hypothetical protein BpHYR1_011577 [Brachionus plicatilis]|uniref:Secreted protein n=1 Tax=Brachionus plicatilis TaxID=10195 RepID=A0A3M7SC23_BRAPC|nr:hypothetical protein BpHYR1_011577 [Brachionus plicatilis]
MIWCQIIWKGIIFIVPRCRIFFQFVFEFHSTSKAEHQNTQLNKQLHTKLRMIDRKARTPLRRRHLANINQYHLAWQTVHYQLLNCVCMIIQNR